MTTLCVSVTELVDAPAASVYDILADYRHGHPSILPEKYFAGLEVLSGGHGAGTILRIQMRVLGSTRAFRMVVSEPEPGRVLVETDLERSSFTRFTVDALQDERTRVTIATEWKPAAGLAGLVERFVLPRLLRTIYREELRLLREVAPRRAATGAREVRRAG